MRATQHSGRIKGMTARHNDRDFDVSKAEHIDTRASGNNATWNCYDGMTFQAAELRYYRETFSGMIAEINARAEKSRHLERKTNPQKLHTSKKTMPEEVIFQIGDKDASVSPELLEDVFSEFYRWHNEKYGSHVKTLNMALHVDEKTPHVHVRRVWTYEENGITKIGQHKALEQMGYQLPDASKERGRDNNLKQVYTAECRQKWLEVCRARGLEIEEVPEQRPASKQNLKKTEYIMDKMDSCIEYQDEELERIHREKAAVQKQLDGVRKELEAAKEELQRHESLQEQYRGMPELEKLIKLAELDEVKERLQLYDDVIASNPELLGMYRAAQRKFKPQTHHQQQEK